MSKTLLTVKETSSFLQVHPNTLYKWVAKEKIPHLKFNGLLRFELDKVTESQRNLKQNNDLLNLLPKVDLSLENYDRMLLKGDSAVSKKKQRWNYGFGAVYSRITAQGKKRWYIDYKLGGKRIRQVVNAAQTRADAVFVLQEKVAASFSDSHNLKRRIKKLKFSEFAEIYLDDYAKTNKKSWMDDKYRIEANMNPFFGEYYLKDISPLIIERYKTERLKSGVTKSTVNRELTIMKKMFNLAIDWKLAKDNPFSKVKLFSEKDTQKERILTKEEEERLLAESPDYLRSILTVALNTGMRRGEILNLKWSQVDFERGIIRVERTKSGKNRLIPINNDVHVVLMRTRDEAQVGKHVFPNPKTGQPYTEVKKSFKAACKRAGISDLRFHDLRHTFATRLIGLGVDLITVRDLLGHFSVRVTQRYTHSNQNQKEDAVRKLNQKTQKGTKNSEALSHIWHISKDESSVRRVTNMFSIN